MKRVGILLAILLMFGSALAAQEKEEFVEASLKAHTFYYNWYASAEHDSTYLHWNHDILPHWSDTTWNNAGSFPGGEDIGANYYPELGCYSSKDTAVISQHFKLMRQAGIGVCVMTWWGPNSFEDQSISTYLDLAEENGIKITFHIEPFYHSALEFLELLVYLRDEYSEHTAIFRKDGKPFYYVYDSYKLKEEEWQKLLQEDGSLSIRNTVLDATFIGLWVTENEGDYLRDAGFDGFYTYFASEGFVYGCTSSNWPVLSNFAKENEMLFIPCVGPGYIDTRIRPWNAANTKSREEGLYYERMFQNALAVDPTYIGITSFNEWHEGSQIEPAIPKKLENYEYEDYGDADPHFYIRKTRELLEMYR